MGSRAFRKANKEILKERIAQSSKIDKELNAELKELLNSIQLSNMERITRTLTQQIWNV